MLSFGQIDFLEKITMVSLNFLRVSIFSLSLAVADPGSFNNSVAEKQVRSTFYLVTAGLFFLLTFNRRKTNDRIQ